MRLEQELAAALTQPKLMETPNTDAGRLTEVIMLAINAELPDLQTAKYNRVYSSVLSALTSANAAMAGECRELREKQVEDKMLLGELVNALAPSESQLIMCRDHFAEAPAMEEWARHCLWTFKKAHVALELYSKVMLARAAKRPLPPTDGAHAGEE